MDPFGQQIGERMVDRPLPRDAVLPLECGAHDLHREMRFAARVVPGMAAMLLAVVDHGEVGRRKCLCEAACDFCGNGACRHLGHRTYIGPMTADEQKIRRRPGERFHGRVAGKAARCAHAGCAEPGEFRAPAGRQPGFDGPGDWQWLCLDHVRAFNSGYNFFEGMSPEEIQDAQRPLAGWERETRAFATAGAGLGPRWQDFNDPLEAINAHFRRDRPREDGKPLSAQDRDALRVLKLDANADRKALRQRYSELVRRYHPDKNGGDRSHEGTLQKVIEAYQQLKSSAAFA